MELSNNRPDKISAEVFETSKSLEFTQNKLDKELQPVKIDIIKIESEMKEFTEDLLDSNLVSDKLIELEDRSRKNVFELMELITNQTKLGRNAKRKS